MSLLQRTEVYQKADHKHSAFRPSVVMNGDVSEMIILLAIVLFGACALAAAGAAHAAEATPTVKQLAASPVTSTTGGGPVAGAPVNGTSPPGHRGHGPVIHPGGHPDEVTTPYGLQLIGAPAIINSPSYVASSNGSSQIVYIHNPSVTFDFPVTPNTIAWWEAGYQLNYKAIGFTGTISVEACLTVNEVENYPDATTAVGVQPPNDPTTCPPEADVVNVQEIPRTWYNVASTNADQYVVQNGLFVNGNAIVAAPVKVPMAMQQILAPMRVHVANGIEYLYRDNHTGPNSADDACPPKWTTTCTNVVEGINFGTDSEFYTGVFNVMTLPTALIQLKLIPRTILYLPPGNNSTTCEKRTQTLSTTVMAGSTAEIDSSTAQDNWIDQTNQADDSIGKILSLGYSDSTDARFDTKTTLKSGQSLVDDVQKQNQTQTWVTIGIETTPSSNPPAVPGASGTYNLAPFWRDEIFVLVHPQLAIWYFSTSQPMQLIAASAGGVASGALPQPDEVPFDVGGLDACARGVAPYSNGYPFTTATGANETLSATECKALAELDPFYGNGQSANLSARAQLIKPATSYGTPPSQTGEGVDSPVSIGTVTSNLTGIGDTNTSTYTSTVDDIVATSWSQGIKLGVKGPFDLGLNNQITLKQGSSIDTSQTMTLTYKDSTAMTNRIDVTDDGSIDDTVNRGYWPQVEIWQDSLFGSFLFRDPDAPVAPSSPATATLESHPAAQPPIVPAQQPVQSKAVFTCP